MILRRFASTLPISTSICTHAIFVFAIILTESPEVWRRRVGIEPTQAASRRPATGLKPARTTRPPAPPLCLKGSKPVFDDARLYSDGLSLRLLCLRRNLLHKPIRLDSRAHVRAF